MLCQFVATWFCSLNTCSNSSLPNLFIKDLQSQIKVSQFKLPVCRIQIISCASMSITSGTSWWLITIWRPLLSALDSTSIGVVWGKPIIQFLLWSLKTPSSPPLLSFWSLLCQYSAYQYLCLAASISCKWVE